MRWGPRKLKRILERDQPGRGWPATSTMGEIVKRAGLVVARKKRHRTEPYTQPLAHALESNRVWCADFKGWFKAGDGTRVDPLTISDAWSRYLLRCQAVEKTNTERVRAIFEAAFREHGLPQAIRTDNGPPFASPALRGLSRLAVWWIKLGIAPERIEPGKPQQNGRHERMHRTMKDEVASKPEADRQAQQLSFDRFRHEYNDVRPHEALSQQTPASQYTTSRRVMPAVLSSPEYPETMSVRRIPSNGCLSWQGHAVHLSDLLRGEPVGVEQIEEDRWRLHYGPVVLAELAIRGKELRLDKQR
jgi:transposase InsO family protein